jgi:hypothetical protein
MPRFFQLLKSTLLFVILVGPQTMFSQELGTEWNPTPAQAAQLPLHYVEASNGLQIKMDGGRAEIEFADVNNDGNVDIVSIGDHGSPHINTTEHGVMVWFGDGQGKNGQWTLFQNGEFGYGGVALGDVNNDGRLDVAFGEHHNYSGNNFGDRIEGIALGDGSGMNWTPWDQGVATNGETYGMFGTDLADVNNDGSLDYGSNSFGCCSGVHVYLNNGDGTWTQSAGFIGGDSNEDFVFADFNGDGNIDAATANSTATALLGDGHGHFAKADGNLPPMPRQGRIGLSVGDVNDDGRDDLAFAMPNGGLEVWTTVSNGVWKNLSGNLPTSGPWEATQIADMNQDGHGDLIAFGHGKMAIIAGDGKGHWKLAGFFTTPGTHGYAAFRAGTDLDHNGYPDIGIIAAEGGGFNPVNHFHVFVESSPAHELHITPMHPRGSATLVPGAVRMIEWNAAVPKALGKATVSLEFSSGDANGPWQMIASGLANNGKYQWRVPRDLSCSAHCYLRYEITAAGLSAAAANMVPAAKF